MRLVGLAGNGVSISYNQALSVPELTAGTVEAFANLAGQGDAGAVLAQFAAKVRGHERQDFEGLLGPLDAVTQALPLLGDVSAPFRDVDWLAGPLRGATTALQRLHRLGLGTVLGLIAERSHRQGDNQLEQGPRALANALVQAAGDDPLTIATLNYDGLLQAALPNDRVADLANGVDEAMVDLGDGTPLRSWPLRREPDFPQGRTIHLLHLHGSLGWFRTTEGHRKFQIDDLRESGAWAMLAQEQLNADPLVVLTDRKERVPALEPFAIGYNTFIDQLAASSHWCIAGYGMHDAPVNHALRRAVQTRQWAGLGEPQVLILNLGDPAELAAQFTGAIGDGVNLLVEGTGLPGSVRSEKWTQWLAA